MNRILQRCIWGTATLLCLSFGVAAYAQDNTSPPPPPTGDMQGPPSQGGPGGPGGPGRRMEEMIKQLNLSAEQAAQFKVIMQTERAQMDALRSETSAGQVDRRKQMMVIHEETAAKIRAILTAEQRTKYDALEAEMRERRRDGGSPPPPPPSQQ